MGPYFADRRVVRTVGVIPINMSEIERIFVRKRTFGEGVYGIN